MGNVVIMDPVIYQPGDGNVRGMSRQGLTVGGQCKNARGRFAIDDVTGDVVMMACLDGVAETKCNTVLDAVTGDLRWETGQSIAPILCLSFQWPPFVSIEMPCVVQLSNPTPGVPPQFNGTYRAIGVQPSSYVNPAVLQFINCYNLPNGNRSAHYGMPGLTGSAFIVNVNVVTQTISFSALFVSAPPSAGLSRPACNRVITSPCQTTASVQLFVTQSVPLDRQPFEYEDIELNVTAEGVGTTVTTESPIYNPSPGPVGSGFPWYNFANTTCGTLFSLC